MHVIESPDAWACTDGGRKGTGPHFCGHLPELADRLGHSPEAHAILRAIWGFYGERVTPGELAAHSDAELLDMAGIGADRVEFIRRRLGADKEG